MLRIVPVGVALAAAVACCVAGCVTVEKSEPTPAEKAERAKLESLLQFGVSIGGNKAETYTARCARIDGAVDRKAAVVFELPENEVVVATIYPCDGNGVAVPGGKPAAIVVYGGNKTSLDKTSDKKPLKKGYHLMDVSAGGKNARVLFEVAK